MKKLFTSSLLCLIAALFLPSMAEAQQRKVARTTLYGTVISSDLWEEGGEYGVYAIPVQKNTSLSKVYGDSLFHTEGTAVYLNGRYYIMKVNENGQKNIKKILKK